jgi:hypothetical protein
MIDYSNKPPPAAIGESSAVAAAPPGSLVASVLAGATDAGDSEANKALFHLAFKRVEPEILALPLDRLTTMNFDVRAVVTTVFGVYPEILAIGRRKQRSGERSLVGIMRQQAYALLADLYEQWQFAVAYVRRKEGDAASIASPLLAGRTGPSRYRGTGAKTAVTRH